MTDLQQRIALESDDEESEGKNSNNGNILHFQDDREFQAYLANYNKQNG